MRRLLRAVLAGVALLGILVGLPIALWLLGRPLLPTSFPTWAEIVAVMSRPDDGDLLLGCIVLVGAVAWLMLACSILLEMVSVLLRRPVLRINLPGFRLSRGIAAALIAALLGLGATPAFAAPATALPAVSATTPTDPATSAPGVLLPGEHPGTPGTAEPEGWAVYEVRTGDTLSAVAADELHDPTRWPEIFDLNVGRVQSDGAQLEDPDLIRPQWDLYLPTAPGTDQTDPTPVPDRSGPTSPPPPTPPLITSPPAPPSPPPTTTPPATAPPSTTPQVTPSPTTAAPPLDGLGEGTTDAPPAAASPTDDGPLEDAAAVALAATAVSSVLAAGLVTALLARRRRQRRHRRPGHRVAVPSDAAGRLEWAARHDAAAPVPPIPHADADDSGPQATAEPGHPLHRLDRALRGLTLTDWQHAPLPDLRLVELSPNSATLWLTTPTTMPEPFTPTDYDNRWLLDADADLEISDAEAAGFCAPFPLLASIATTGENEPAEGDVLFLDLEQAGVSHITGPAQRVDGLLHHLVTELANAPWADDVEILLADATTSAATQRPHDLNLEALNPERVRQVSLATGLAELQARMDATRTALQAAASVLDARLRNAFPLDAWLPTILIIRGTPDMADLDDIVADLTTGQRRAAAIVIAHADPDGGPESGSSAGLPGTLISLSDDGELRMSDAVAAALGDPDALTDFGGRPWGAHHLHPATTGHIVEVLATTDQPDVPAGPADGNEPWAQDMTEDGRHDPPDPAPDPPGVELAVIPLEQPDHTANGSVNGSVDDSVGAAGQQHHNPTGRFVPLPNGADAHPSRAASLDPEAQRLLDIVHRQDPHLDDDLAHWHSDTPLVPMVAILGTPQVRAPGVQPSTRVSWFVEVLVYLCLHPAGVSVQQALTDLWPNSPAIRPSTVRHAFYGARRWAGTPTDPDTGQSGPTFVSDMLGSDLYRIQGHLLDWDLFRRLRKRAQARYHAGHPDAITDYRAALDLVRGPVLSGLRPRGYAWLNNHHQRHDLQIPGFIADTAHELVDVALAVHDLALARWAAETARSIDIDGVFDEPLTDLMRIAHIDGNTAELERLATILLDSRDTDVPEDLPPATFAVLDRLLPDGPRRTRPHPPS